MSMTLKEASQLVKIQEGFARDSKEEYHIGMYNGMLIGMSWLDPDFKPCDRFLSAATIETENYTKLDRTMEDLI